MSERLRYPVQVSPENSEVLEIIPLHKDASFAEESVVDEATLWIDDVEQRVRVHALRRCEHHHLQRKSHVSEWRV